MNGEEESEFVEHIHCESCGSSDANAVYTDGHTFCFSCEKRTVAAGTGESRETTPRKPSAFQMRGEIEELVNRKISKRVCQKYNYRVDHDSGSHLAVYHDPKSGEAVAAKIRKAGKQFSWIGDTKRTGLYGQHLFDGGRKLIITEGEIDALSVSMVNGEGKWPVVSVPNGAAGAKRDCAKQIEWLEKFDSVIVMFDMDEPGQKAAVEVAELLSPGKVKIATLPLKDANEVLVNGKPGDITSAMWDAREYRPDGIINASDTWEDVVKVEEQSEFEYPYHCLNQVFKGMRRGEIVTFVAGSGSGKSAIVREIAYHQLMLGHTLGAMFLEEGTRPHSTGDDGAPHVQAHPPPRVPRVIY